LAIVMVTMAGILAWGVPAIQGLQEHAEFQSVQTQMLELNQELRNLRDPQNTRVATISIADGTIQTLPGDRWVITAMTDPGMTGLKITGYDDDDATSIEVDGVPVTVPAHVATMHSFPGAKPSQYPIAEESCSLGSCTLSNISIDLTRDVYRIQITESSLVRAEAWIVNAGRFTYTQAGGRNMNHLEMGASVIEQADRFYMRQGPTVKEPAFDAIVPDTDFFVRLVQLQGSDAVSGTGSFSILVNLVDNHGETDERPVFDSARLVRFQIHGDLEEAFCNAFLSRSTDYTYDGSSTDCAGGDADVLYDPPQAFSFEMSQAVVSGYARST
jgi:hypothetical protein